MNSYIIIEAEKKAEATGCHKERLRIAENLSYFGLSFELIYLITNLSKQEILNIKQEQNKITSSIN